MKFPLDFFMTFMVIQISDPDLSLVQGESWPMTHQLGRAKTHHSHAHTGHTQVDHSNASHAIVGHKNTGVRTDSQTDNGND